MNQSGNVLAFLGDAYLSLQVRSYLIDLGYNQLKKMQETSVLFVSAEGQAKFMNQLLEDNLISEDEMIYYKRGRNAKSRSMAKNAEMIDYRVATGLESLWGYLYLKEDFQRLDQLWSLFKESVGLNNA
ncbi:MAG TPA: ribonuclease III domain-containing protein [Erysipelothrix sp.]|nr:ribonuclease III domain-containing protein [Erysipelothrix sp.]